MVACMMLIGHQPRSEIRAMTLEELHVDYLELVEFHNEYKGDPEG